MPILFRSMTKRSMTVLRTLFPIALSLSVALPAAVAQTPSQQGDDPAQIETLEVFLPVMVFDKKGEFVPGLTRANFRVFEDGVEQQISSFDAPTQLPLNIAMLIDTSS